MSIMQYVCSSQLVDKQYIVIVYEHYIVQLRSERIELNEIVYG